MARDNESTMQWKLDIADLKKNMTDARNQIKLANAEFKNATAGMGRWSDSATGVAAKTKQLQSVLSSQRTILADLKRQYELVSQEMGETSPQAQRLKVQIENQEAAVKKTESQLEGYNDRLEELQSQEREADTAFGKLTSTIDEQEKQLADLKDEYAKAAINFGENSDEAKDLARQIGDLSGDLQENKAKLDSAQDAAESFDKSLEDVNQSAGDTGGIDAMKVALGNLISQGIQAAIQGLKDLAQASYDAWAAYDEGADTIIAATGATGDAADDLMNAYSGVASNIVADFSDIGTAVGEVSTRFGLTGDALQGLSEDFLRFAQLNGVDVKTAVDASQAAMAAWGIEAQDAGLMLDTLNAAGQATGVSVDKLADSMVTNAPALQEMGYSASDAAMFLANLEKNGVDASSTLAGMKRALTNAAAEGKPMSQAMQEMEESIRNAGSSTEAITIATELFGTKAGASIANAVRDGNLSFAELGTAMADFEGNVNQTFENTLDAPDKLALAMQGVRVELADMAGQLMEEFGPQIEQAFAYVKDELIPTLKDAITWAMNNLPEIASAIAGIGTAMAAMKVVSMVTGAVEAFKAWKVATDGMTLSQKLLNAAQMASPIGLVVGLIAGLVAALIVLWNTNEDFRNKVIEVWGNVKEFVGGAVDAIRVFFTETIPNAITSMVNWFAQIPAKIGAFLSTAIAKVKAWAAQMGASALAAARGFLNNVVTFVSQIPTRIGAFLSSAISRVASWAGQLASRGRAAAQSLLNAVVSTVRQIPSRVADVGMNLVRGIWNGISNGLGWIKGKISGWVGDVTGFIKRLFGIASPSKVMRDEVGKYLAQGIAVGFGDEMPAVMKSMQRDMGGMVDNLRGDVSIAANGIAGGGIAGAGMVSGMGGVPTAAGARVQNVYFEQTINSPNAIDRLSIYRDTKSLLFTAKGGLQHV